MVNIRKYHDEDAFQLQEIFFRTIRTINRRDYSEAAVRAWAPDDIDPARWLRKMQAIQPFVAELDEQIVGYADLQDDGLIDHFFCHPDHQSQGIGRALMQRIFAQADSRGLATLHSHVSLTAKPFFLHFGFEAVQEQQVKVRGQMLNNTIMKKRLIR